MKTESKPIPAIVRQIVDRCHVGDSNRRVIRYFISRLKHGYRTWMQIPRADRKRYLSFLLRVHQENRALYRDVMTGR